MQIDLINYLKDDYLYEFIEIFLEKENKFLKKKLFLDVKFKLEKSNENYFICFVLNPPYNIRNYKGNINFNIKGKHHLEKVEKNFNFEMTDLYTPNKKAIVMKDIIQCKEDLNLSFFFRLSFIRKSNSYITTNSKMNFYKQNSNENVIPDLLGKTCDNNGEEFDFKDKIRMRLKISRKNETIISEDFYNQIFIPNLVLKKTELYSADKLNLKTIKDFKLDIYNFEIFFDSSEIPFWIKNYKSFDNEFIGWVIKVHSTKKVNFYVDTIKEDTENFIKDNWETEEPGRKDLAKLARKKFLLYNKKKNGELMTIEEEEILNIPRKKKMKIKGIHEKIEKIKLIEEKTEKEEREEYDKSNKDEGYNLNSTKNEFLKTDENKDREKEREKDKDHGLRLPGILHTDINEKKTLRPLEDYVNKKIRSFWDITNKERISVKNSLSLDHKILLTEQIHEEKVNNLENKIKIYEDIYKKQLKKEEKMKRNIDHSLKSFYNKSNKKLNRKNFIIGELATTRENFKSKFNFHRESEIGLMNILRLESEINDINKCVEYYNTLKNSEFKTDNFNLSKIHQVISNNKEKLILNDIAKFGIKDKALMKKHFEDYINNKWNYNYTTIQKLKAFI